MTRIGTIDGTLKSSVPLLEVSQPDLIDALSAGVWNDLKWMNELFVTSDFDTSHVTVDGQVMVYTTGLYCVEYELCLKYDSGSGADTAVIRTCIEVNDVDVDDSFCYFTIYAPANVDQAIQIKASKIIFLQHGDLINISIISSKTGVTMYSATPEFYGRFRILYIPVGGWNNNTGGSVINRGIRR